MKKKTSNILFAVIGAMFALILIFPFIKAFLNKSDNKPNNEWEEAPLLLLD